MIQTILASYLRGRTWSMLCVGWSIMPKHTIPSSSIVCAFLFWRFLFLKLRQDSGHGGQTRDLDGDEVDGWDEGPTELLYSDIHYGWRYHSHLSAGLPETRTYRWWCSYYYNHFLKSDLLISFTGNARDYGISNLLACLPFTVTHLIISAGQTTSRRMSIDCKSDNTNALFRACLMYTIFLQALFDVSYTLWSADEHQAYWRIYRPVIPEQF